MKKNTKREPMITKENWKQFVITCCELKVANTSKQIADAINRNAGLTITSGQIAAIKANYSRGAYSK